MEFLYLSQSYVQIKLLVNKKVHLRIVQNIYFDQAGTQKVRRL